MKRIVYAVPSYRRPSKCYAAKMLASLGVPKEDLFVTVQNDEDRAAYQQSVGGIAQVVGSNGTGISFNRNQAMLPWLDDVWVCQIDDGVKRVFVKEGDRCVRLTDGERFRRMVRLFFEDAARRGFAMWGTFKSSFPMAMRTCELIDTPFVGTFVGLLDRRDRFNPSMKLMEDLERNCRLLKCGKHIVRHEFVTIDCLHNQGGSEADARHGWSGGAVRSHRHEYVPAGRRSGRRQGQESQDRLSAEGRMVWKENREGRCALR